MGLLTITPTHYEGLLWMAMWFVLLAALPLINSFYNSGLRYVPVIPMQSSMVQTSAFIIYMLSMYCAASMLPCGRYYYDPEGGYVGNPWVKFSYQYAYLYMAWIVHHLDVLEHYAFQYANTYALRASTLYSKSFGKMSRTARPALSTRVTARLASSTAYKSLSSSWSNK
jgi:hypothetical protein